MRPALAITLLCLFPLPMLAGTILAEGGEHEAFNYYPFGSSFGSGEYQQVYSSSLFAEPVWITSLAFSPQWAGAYSANVELRLTTTSVAVGALSTVLSSNYTLPLTTVFSDASFSQTLASGGPESFSLVFDFSGSPFYYDPANGNLLLDVLISGQSVIAFSRSTGGAVYSRAYDRGDGYPYADGVGLRTLIGYESAGAVPEPATLALSALGLGALMLGRRRCSMHDRGRR